MQCPQHGVEFILKPAGISKKTGKPYNAFWACPASYDCREKPPEGQQANYAPRPSYHSTGSTPARNFDREAYEKCCSIWAAARLGQNAEPLTDLEEGYYWKLFQAIRADGQKRFATGWAKAQNTFQEKPLSMKDGYADGGDIDMEAGNRAIADLPPVDTYPINA